MEAWRFLTGGEGVKVLWKSPRVMAAGSTAAFSYWSLLCWIGLMAIHQLGVGAAAQGLAGDGQLAAYRHQRFLAADGHIA